MQTTFVERLGGIHVHICVHIPPWRFACLSQGEERGKKWILCQGFRLQDIQSVHESCQVQWCADCQDCTLDRLRPYVNKWSHHESWRSPSSSPWKDIVRSHVCSTELLGAKLVQFARCFQQEASGPWAWYTYDGTHAHTHTTHTRTDVYTRMCTQLHNNCVHLLLHIHAYTYTRTHTHTHTYTNYPHILHTPTYYAHIDKLPTHTTHTHILRMCTQLDNDMAHVCVHNWTTSVHSCVRCPQILDWPFTKSVLVATHVSQNNCVNVCSIPQMTGRLVFIKAT